MKKDGKEFSVTLWSAVALGAVGIGVIVAFLAGYFLGHFTGHENTTTVSAISSSAAGAEPEGEETEGAEEVTEAPQEGTEEGSEEGSKGEAAPKGEGGEKATAGGAPNPEAGAEVFAENCSICHGSTGHGGNGGPDLRTMPKAKTEAGAVEQVTDGGGGMPAFGGTLSEEEINDVAAYVVHDVVGGG